jgi:two-component system, NarL family, sensor histidine kinase UhpB
MDPKLKLLILEDNPDDAALVQKLLHRSGMNFEAKVTANAREFLKALDEDGFDVVLADNALPQYNSIEALKVIKKRNPFIAFILVTGTVSEEFAVDVIQRGADDYILKTNLTRLPAAILKAAENKNVQKQKYLAEKEMLELNEQLRQLAAHLQNVREVEQIRIAREIHDELGQMLTAIKMDITSANKKMKESIYEAEKDLSKALEMVDNTVKAVRKISSELRPSILDDLGLVAALEWQSMEFEKRNNIRSVFFSSIADISIDSNIATVMYRIYQEALTNISRHSEATNVTAELMINDEQLILIISDNGKGFDPDTAKAKKHLGLVGMKERALMVNGKFAIKSTTGKGTTITISIPAGNKRRQ